MKKSVSPRVTPLGATYGLLLALAMLGTFSLRYLAPESWVGRLMSTGVGVVAGTGVFVAIGYFAEVLLTRRGYRLLRPPDDDERRSG